MLYCPFLAISAIGIPNLKIENHYNEQWVDSSATVKSTFIRKYQKQIIQPIICIVSSLPNVVEQIATMICTNNIVSVEEQT